MMTRQKGQKYLMLSFVGLFGVVLLRCFIPGKMFQCHGQDRAAIPTEIAPERRDKFVDVIRRYSSPEHVLYMALVDSGVLDMAFNFYVGSVQRHKIGNYLFLSLSQHACDELQSRGVHCFTYSTDQASEQTSDYMTVDFNRKMNMRTSAILDVLQQGISLISADLDIVFTKDPWPSITEHRGVKAGCDVAALWDDTEYNAGFLFLNSTSTTVSVFRRMKQLFTDGCMLPDQVVLNSVLADFPSTRVVKLDPNRFSNGYYFFEQNRRYFAGDEFLPCPNCVVVHNNFIVSTAAKVYRFREAHMWFIDKDQYYSNMSAKYLTYENPVDFGSQEENFKQAKHALQTALAIGHILNRIVILPKFWCYSKFAVILTHRYKCPLNALISIATFDSAYANKYREHSFLSNPLVPRSVKTSISPAYIITASSTPRLEQMVKNTADVFTKQPTNIIRGMTTPELKNTFGSNNYSVLRFHSLYGNILNYERIAKNKFLQGVEKALGFAKSSYKQFYVGKV